MGQRGIKKRRYAWDIENQDTSGVPGNPSGEGAWDDELLREIFAMSLDRSLQLCDPWGKYTKLSREERLDQCYLCTPEQKRVIAADCHVSPVVRTQVSVLVQAVAATLEQLSGDLIQTMVELNDEGFDRLLIYTGRTVLVAKSIRGGFPFPFVEYGKLLPYGLSCIREGLLSRERFMHWQMAELS